jgi:hypothetical protein
MGRCGHGWLVFASSVLITAGAVRRFDAMSALRHNSALLDGPESGVLGRSCE